MSAAAASASSSTLSGQGSLPEPTGDDKNSVVIKVGMVGDSQIGKTSLMVKYVEGSFDEDYIQTLGVNFMEKTITVRRTTITFSIWDLGGQREFVNMLPLVCNDAVAILFMFDLSRKSTLNSVKEWYRQARGFNKTAIPFLVGTKFDVFSTFPRDEQEEITKQAKRFARAMKASLIFCSTSASINVQKIFKIVLAKVSHHSILRSAISSSLHPRRRPCVPRRSLHAATLSATLSARRHVDTRTMVPCSLSLDNRQFSDHYEITRRPAPCVSQGFPENPRAQIRSRGRSGNTRQTGPRLLLLLCSSTQTSGWPITPARFYPAHVRYPCKCEGNLCILHPPRMRDARSWAGARIIAGRVDSSRCAPKAASPRPVSRRLRFTLHARARALVRDPRPSFHLAHFSSRRFRLPRLRVTTIFFPFHSCSSFFGVGRTTV